jgi:hypothetical protein
MITRVLAQVIEDLCILHNSAGSLGQGQEFIEFSLNESLWNVVHSESGPKFVPGDNVSCRLHGVIMIPQYVGGAAKLLSYKECLVRVLAWCRQQCELGLYSVKPGVSIEGLVCFMEQWGLSAEKVLVTSRWMFITAAGLVIKLAHLGLH